MEIIYLALLTLLASLLGTVSGFGTSTIMIPVLVIFFPPLEAIFFVTIIHWFGDVWKIILFRKGFNLKLIALFGVTGLIASYLGASLSLETGGALLLRLLGLFLAVYGIFLVFQSKFKVSANNATAMSGGALSGFFAGMFGIGGPLRAMFLSAFNLPKTVFIATAGAIGLLVDIVRLITYSAGGTTLPSQLWLALLILIPISFIGARLAKSIVDKIPQHRFRKMIAVLLAVIGLKLVLFS